MPPAASHPNPLRRIAEVSPRPAKGTPSVPAVERVFAILEVLAQSKTGLTLRDLAHVCKMPKSTAHCIVITLERAGYLHRDGHTSRYLFGRKLLRLANYALAGQELRERARSQLLTLSTRTRLPSHLAVIEADEVVILAKADYPVAGGRVASWIGKRMELHCTALGKALISEWGDQDLTRLATERTLPRHNENTICTVRALRQELDAARAAGYTMDDEEDILGIRCAGVPVLDAGGGVIAAFSITGTTGSITVQNIETIATELRTASRSLSESLAASA